MHTKSSLQASRSHAQSREPSSHPGPVLELLADEVDDEVSATPLEELESASSVVELELEATVVPETVGASVVLPSLLLELELAPASVPPGSSPPAQPKANPDSATAAHICKLFMA